MVEQKPRARRQVKSCFTVAKFAGSGKGVLEGADVSVEAFASCPVVSCVVNGADVDQL